MNNKTTMPLISSFFCALITVSLTLNASDPSKNVKGKLEIITESSQVELPTGAAQPGALNAAQLPQSAESAADIPGVVPTGAPGSGEVSGLKSQTPSHAHGDKGTIEFSKSNSIQNERVARIKAAQEAFDEKIEFLKNKLFELFGNENASFEKVRALKDIPAIQKSYMAALNASDKALREGASRATPKQIRDKQIRSWAQETFNKAEKESSVNAEIRRFLIIPDFKELWNEIAQQSIQKTIADQQAEIKRLQDAMKSLTDSQRKQDKSKGCCAIQ